MGVSYPSSLPYSTDGSAGVVTNGRVPIAGRAQPVVKPGGVLEGRSLKGDRRASQAATGDSREGCRAQPAR